MSKLSRNLTADTMHPRESLFTSGTLGAANAELVLDADGCNVSALAVSGTYVGTLALEGSIDGTNYDVIPVRVPNGVTYLASLASAATGRWHGQCSPYRRVRVRMATYTSGSASVILMNDAGLLETLALTKPADLSVTNTGATGAAVTLTIPSGGTGLAHYFTRILIQRHTSALLTAGSTPILVTTTNMPGSRVFSIPADAAPQGQVYTEVIDAPTPLRSSATGTATTFVAPATTGVIWRLTADYYLGA